MQDIKYSKTCFICGNVIFYKTKGSYWANKNKNAPCWKCDRKIHSKRLQGRERSPFSDKWKKNIAESHKKSEVWKMSMNTPEYKEKHRQKMIKMIKENKTTTAFNKNACKVFDFINQKLGWNGQHGMNGKEKVVDVFFIDYYEPNLNIAVEWDESHHHKKHIRQKDGFKSKIVMETIGCQFYRIDEMFKSVRKIDHLTENYSDKIKNCLQEYYETQN